jgi:hypothetical protein
MKTMSNTTTITTEKGTVVKMVVTAIRGYEKVKEIAFCDGDNIEIETGKDTNENNITLTINGKDYIGYFTTKMPASVLKGCFGVFLAGNQPIGLSQVKYNELINIVNLTKKEAETDETWMVYQTKKTQLLKEEIEYDNHVKAVENMMTLNGHTY